MRTYCRPSVHVGAAKPLCSGAYNNSANRAATKRFITGSGGELVGMVSEARHEWQRTFPAVGLPASRTWRNALDKAASAKPFRSDSYDLIKASKSALMASACVVHMPCGKPL